MEHQQNVKDDILQDFQDGELCKSHLNIYGHKVLLLIYGDDVEVCNPLGSRKHKIGLMYFTIKSLPRKYTSALEHIYLLAVYNNNDAKAYGMDQILRPIINDLKSLESDGIDIETDVFSGNIRFGVAQVVGDNMGVHGLLGFVESFSANFPCRHCKISRDEIQTQYIASSVLRNEHNYMEDVAINDVSATGIRRNSIFNELQTFHVTRNYAPDIMHDVLEGVCMWELKIVIRELIRSGKFTLELLNGRITSYDYGFTDKCNKPTCFTEKDLRSPNAAGQTAAQMWCIMRHFCLMMGDCVEEDNQYWEVILLLIECMDIIFSPVNTVGETRYLTQLIRDHHQMYVEVFEAHLKPKHHFMLHYAKAIREIGPLGQYWAMRFEAKHNDSKQMGHVICNFKNIPLSLAVKHQMQLCYTLHTRKSLEDSMLEVGPGEATVLASLDDAEIISNLLDNYPLFDDVFIAKWIKFCGTIYRKGMILVVGKCPDEDPNFGKIHEVLVLPESKVKFIVQPWSVVGYSRHLHAYVVQKPSILTRLASCDVEQLGENADAELSEKELEPGEVCESVAKKSTNRWIRKEAVKVPDKTMMSAK
nr:uncharacterized protein LOC129263367 [Lytechinus pictus]